MANTKFSSLTALTAPEPGDGLPIVDGYGTSPDGKIITLLNMFKVINGLTVDSQPIRTTDYVVTYDASDSAARKVFLKDTGELYIHLESSTGINPADATSYHFGSAYSAAAVTGGGLRRIYIPRTGTITAAYARIAVGGTLATTEDSTLYIRLNDTTNYTVSSTVKLNSATNLYNSTSLTIPITAGDYIEGRFTAASWATNPTDVYFYMDILLS